MSGTAHKRWGGILGAVRGWPWTYRVTTPTLLAVCQDGEEAEMNEEEPAAGDAGAVGGGLAVLRRRLRFRSWHRGTREVDLILGGFADRWIDTMDAGELQSYEALLEQNDADLYDWFTDKAPPAPEVDAALFGRIKADLAQRFGVEGEGR